MITKFVVRKTFSYYSIKISHYETLETAIERAKEFYKYNELERKLFGYEIIVEESRFANEKKMNQDFAIDRHVRWASYFDTL